MRLTDIDKLQLKLREYADKKAFNGEIEVANGILKAKCFIDQECHEVVKQMNRPEKLDTWFYMAMKEMRRNSYMDLIESWDISEKEANEVENYIEEKLDVRL